MDIVSMNDKDQWNDYIKRHALNDGGFLQSFEWGEFQKLYGRKVLRFGIMQNNETAYGWQVIELRLPFGLKYWYVPRPAQFPIFLKNFIQEVTTLARKEGVVFLRVDGANGLEKFGFGKVNISVQPEEELICDITQPEEELLAEMKQKTRYNIRVAEKHGVKISDISLDPELKTEGRYPISNIEFENFWSLIFQTSARQGIRPHPKEYYKKMIEALGKEGCGKLYCARYQNKVIAGIFVVFFGNTATYLHGGSDDEYKNVMAPYLLHWKAIGDAKLQGFERYNFGGVSSAIKSWEGITRFKTGFSPNMQFTKYGGVWDLPVKKFLYRGYMLLKKF